MVAEQIGCQMGYVGDVTECHPRPWRSAVLSDLAHYRRGSFPQPYGLRRWYDDIRGFPFIQVFDVDDNGRLKETTKRRISAEARALSVSVPEGTVILTIQGSIGRVAITQYDACIDRTLLIFERFKVPIDKRYFKYAIFELFEREKKNAPGGIIKTITKEALSKFQLVYPPLPEQQAIATALSDADAYIESLEQLITKKRHIRQGVMQELLTGKRRLPGFEGEWRRAVLEDVGIFIKGKGVSKSEARSGDLPCVRYGEIYTRHQDVIRKFYSGISGEVAASATRLRFGDLLFAGSGETKEEIGKCVAFCHNCEAYAGGDIVVLRQTSCAPVFLGYYLNTPEIVRQKASRGQGDAVVHISAGALASIEIFIPEQTEQRAIAEILSDMDGELFLLGDKLVKARHLKQAMMQQLLTGKIRLV